MTDIDVYRPQDPAAQLVAWAHAASAAHTLATSLVKTNVCPEAFRGKADEAAAVVLLGAELGMSPIAALRSMFVIRGQVSMYVRSQVALVQSRGHRVWTVQETDDTVTVAGWRNGDPADRVEHVTWTIARARQAGFIRRGRDNAPSQYELQPRAMLWARAAGEVCRRIAADVLQGIPETIDEPVDAADTATGSGTTTVQRRGLGPVRPVVDVEVPVLVGATDQAESARPGRSAAAETVADDRPTPPARPVDEPAATVVDVTGADEIPDDEPPADDEEPLITTKQRGLLLPTLNALGARDHDVRVRWLTDVLGRPVESSNDLTVTEASAAIDAARAELAERERDARGGVR
jgi:hypothetical protein